MQLYIVRETAVRRRENCLLQNTAINLHFNLLVHNKTLYKVVYYIQVLWV